MDVKTGGPAFPLEEPIANHSHFGMTLRDYFAAKAMQGLFAAGRDPQFGGDCIDGYAEAAYAMADSMLAERDK